MDPQNIDATDRTLILGSPWHVLAKLDWEIDLAETLAARPIVPYGPGDSPLDYPTAAVYSEMNAISTAWSITDWVWHDPHAQAHFSQFFGRNISGRKDYQMAVRKACRELDACHQICNSVKHRMLDRLAANQDFTADVVYDIYQSGDQLALRVTGMSKTRHASGSTFLAPLHIARVARAWWADALDRLAVPKA